MKEGKIELLEDGIKKECSIIFSFEQNGKNYIVYTDDKVDEDGFILKDAQLEKAMEVILAN